MQGREGVFLGDIFYGIGELCSKFTNIFLYRYVVKKGGGEKRGEKKSTMEVIHF